MAGKVYMYNISGEDMNKIQIDTVSATDVLIPGWGRTNENEYKPHCAAFDRVKYPEDKPTFAQGENTVTYHRTTFRGDVDITIDAAISLNDDLVLYMTPSMAILMRDSGEIVSETPISIKLFETS
jgi:hypothetical protein